MKKTNELEVSLGLAAGKLRKQIMFSMARKLNLITCFRCETLIEDVDSFSIDHKIPWRFAHNCGELFFDLENIAFSHLRCNSGAARRSTKILNNKDIRIRHGTCTGYERHGCRCVLCVAWKSNKNSKRQRRKNKNGNNLA